MLNLRIRVRNPKQRGPESGQAGGANLDLPDQPTETGAVLPFWFEYLILIAGAIVLAVGGVGLLMADLGFYSAAWSIPIGLLIAAGCVLLARPTQLRRQEPPEHRLEGILASMGVCVLAIGQALWNFAYAGEHLAVDRDPGVYTVTARWLANHPSLIVPTGPWRTSH